MAGTEIVNRFNAIRLGEYRQINREHVRMSVFIGSLFISQNLFHIDFTCHE